MRYHWLVKRALSLVATAALLATVVVAAIGVARATVTFNEESLALAPGEIRILNARTPFGVPARGGLSWSVEPSWLGKMDERGGFHAAEVSGTGTVTARLGPASAQIPVTVTCPKVAEIQGIRFDVSCGRSADVYVHVDANGGAERARDEVDRESDRVSRDLQIASDLRFRVYYLGSTQAFTSAVSWLGRGFTSGPTVRETEAVYLDLPDFIAIDQSQMAQFQTANAVRHELVHRSLRQFVGYANIDEVPSWLNEGWAFLEEAESGRLYTEARVASASGAFFGKLPPLDALGSLSDWNSRTGLDHVYQYYISLQATQFLIEDMTLPGLLRALKIVGEGEPFKTALTQAVPTFDYSSFARRFSDRVKALVQEYPGIVAARGSPDGFGSTVIAYGLRPGVPVTVTTTGPLERVFSGNADAYGVYVKYLGIEWPVGEYRVTIEAEGRRLQVTATR
jgi:hypothetical protein